MLMRPSSSHSGWGDPSTPVRLWDSFFFALVTFEINFCIPSVCAGLIVEARKLEHGFRRISARIPYTKIMMFQLSGYYHKFERPQIDPRPRSVCVHPRNLRGSDKKHGLGKV